MWLILDIAVRLVVGVLLVSAGTAKFTSTPVWRELWLASYRLLPRGMVSPVARSMSVAEIVSGLALITGVSVS